MCRAVVAGCAASLMLLMSGPVCACFYSCFESDTWVSMASGIALVYDDPVAKIEWFDYGTSPGGVPNAIGFTTMRVCAGMGNCNTTWSEGLETGSATGDCEEPDGVLLTKCTGS